MIRRGLFLFGVLTFACCTSGEHADVKKWMTDATKGMQGKVEKIDEPKKFAPFKYESEKAIDPFNTSKIAQISEDKKTGTKGGGLCTGQKRA